MQKKIDDASKIIKMVGSKVSNDSRVLFEQFVKRLFESSKHNDIEKLSHTTVTTTFVNLWEAFKKRAEGGQPVVNIYNIKLPAEEGGARIIIDIINDNRPFLVDSIVGYLRYIGMRTRVFMRPILLVQRNNDGEIKGILGKGAKESSYLEESIIHCEVTDNISAKELKELKAKILEIQKDVKLATQDWQRMRARVHHAIGDLSSVHKVNADEISEITEFMEWMNNDHFTFLGYKEINLASKEYNKLDQDTQSLGILTGKTAKEICEEYHGIKMNRETYQFLKRPEPLVITKCTKISTVHRAVPADSISLKRYDAKGNVVGIHQFIGLFTSIAYSSSARDTPLLRKKVLSVVEQAGYNPMWHDGKALMHILDTLPRDELFQASTEELVEISKKVLTLLERPKVVMFVRTDIFERFLSCLVYIPEDWFEYDLIEQIARVLEKEMNCGVVVRSSEYGAHNFARIHYMLPLAKRQQLNYDIKKIEKKLSKIAISWRDNLRNALLNVYGEWDGQQLMHKYDNAFNKGYQERFSEIGALRDIEYIERAINEKKLQIRLYRRPQDAKTKVRVKLYNYSTPIPLSDVIPILENIGLRILSEIPYVIHPHLVPQAIWLHDFEMETGDKSDLDLDAINDNFLEVFSYTWTGVIENDIYNSLVVKAGLNWQQCLVLRAYSKYLHQILIPFSHVYMGETLLKNAEITKKIVELFMKRFDPNEKKFNQQTAVDDIQNMIEKVVSPDEDRILRRFLNLVLATVRTNFFQREKQSELKPYLSFKLNSHQIEELPLPKPKFEIFVYSSKFEAVHLRGGKVARGGIRWSDRREDFRTEILGLVKAQMVKNAVIVPTGSKGGFVLKIPTEDMSRDEIMQTGIACYQSMMCALLEITDNLAAGKIVPPVDVRCYDENDPYLVVAADKGTATFSDIANSISEEKKFWLTDAFASGGSQGYDHKAMGITARGAWEAVKCHFYKIGIDMQAEEFTVIGIGDMSGDVFGNGMLLSDKICLQAAFNHKHIFIDPNPNAQKSYQERRRCFNNRLGWDGYDIKLISRGGGIFERSAKSIKLSPEIKKFLNLDISELKPSELIRHILKADVDLLWFGGIGTYVKAKMESHADAGDHANDSVRVNASELRCKVIGEGANLGMTQRARIEFERHGGQINTDAIDNSAGVDCSDHEVNIKILLQQILDAGEITIKQRNKLLEDMTDEVAKLVLLNNTQQNLAITLIHAQGFRLLDQQAKFMRLLEREGRLDRALEFLPDDVALEEYQANQIGLSRPEIAVVMSYAKNTLYNALMKTSLPDEKFLQHLLQEYFPNVLRQRYSDFIKAHPLRREIVATVATNEIVNRMGGSFVFGIAEKTGQSYDDVVRAYYIASNIYGFDKIWQDIENQVDLKAENRIKALSRVWKLVRRITTWILRSFECPLDVEEISNVFKKSIKELHDKLDNCLNQEICDRFVHDENKYEKLGLSQALARRLARLEVIASSPDIVLIAREAKASVVHVAGLYFAVGTRFWFSRLRHEAEDMEMNTFWQRQAGSAFIEDMYIFQNQMTKCILHHFLNNGDTRILKHGVKAGVKAVEKWCDMHHKQCKIFDQLLHDARTSGGLNQLPILTVLKRELRFLSEKCCS